MSASVRFTENRGIIEVNPAAKLLTFVDKWNSQGFMALLGKINETPIVKQVTYDLARVSQAQIMNVAEKMKDGSFDCPACKQLHETEHTNEPLDTKEVEEVEEEIKKEATKNFISLMDSILLIRLGGI